MRIRTIRYGILAAALAAVPALASDGFFDSAGVRVHYSDQGQGEPVVLVHGFGGSFVRHWGGTGIPAALSGKYRVIGIDIRGHGESEKPHDRKLYGKQMAEDVVRLLDHLKIPQAHVAGYSMGGRIAAYLLVAHPGRLRSAMVGGAGCWCGDAPAREELMVQLAESLETGKGFGPLVFSLLPPDQPPPGPEQMAAIDKMMLAVNDPLALAAASRANPELELPAARFRGVKLPVLIMVGEKDPRRSDSERLKDLIPKAELAVIPQATHMNAYSTPLFREKLLAFLAGN